MKRVLLLLLLAWSSAQAVTFDEAIIFYEQQRFEDAYAAFDELGQVGNERALLNIGIMHFRGEFVPQDSASALAWIKLAQDHGSPDAENLAQRIASQLNDAQRKEADLLHQSLLPTYGKQAVEQQYLIKQTGVRSSIKPAVPIFSKNPVFPRHLLRKSLSGSVDLHFMVDKDGTARFIGAPLFTHRDFALAGIEALLGSRFEPAQIAGKPTRGFGTKYRFNFQVDGKALSVGKVEKYLETHAHSAHTGGGAEKLAYALNLTALRSTFKDAKGFERFEWDNPSDWFQRAAQDGSAAAKYHLGLGFMAGDQCDVDINKGVFWLASAASSNVADAKMILGYEYLSGLRVQKDEAKGLALIKSAADGSLSHAQIFYAWIISTHPAVEQRLPDVAAAYLAKVDPGSYQDLRSYFETETAIALAVGDWKAAKKSLQRLAKFNKKHGVDSYRQIGLAHALENKQAYTESI